MRHRALFLCGLALGVLSSACAFAGHSERRVQVYAPGEGPMGGAYVALWGPVSRPSDDPPTIDPYDVPFIGEAFADGQGFALFPPGVAIPTRNWYYVQVEAEGQPDYQAWVWNGGVTLTWRVEFPARYAAISIEVLDGTHPSMPQWLDLPGIAFRLEGMGLDLTGETVAGQGGQRFWFRRLPPGPYRLSVMHLGFFTETQDVDLPLGDSATVVTLIPDGTLCFPTFILTSFYQAGWTFPMQFELIDADGEVVVAEATTQSLLFLDSPLAPGEYTVYVTSADGQESSQMIRLDAGVQRILLDP